MSVGEREAFLAGVHVGVISIGRPAGPPLAVPVWYDYTPGGEVRVQMGPESVKYRLISTAGAFSLVAQNEAVPYKYVSVQGPVVGVDSPTPQADTESMARRYLDDDAATEYLKTVVDVPALTVRMRPDRWYTVDFSA